MSGVRSRKEIDAYLHWVLHVQVPGRFRAHRHVSTGYDAMQSLDSVKDEVILPEDVEELKLEWRSSRGRGRPRKSLEGAELSLQTAPSVGKRRGRPPGEAHTKIIRLCSRPTKHCWTVWECCSGFHSLHLDILYQCRQRKDIVAQRGHGGETGEKSLPMISADCGITLDVCTS